MIGHFPIPYPDELLYSVCARAFAYWQPPSKKGFCELLYGSGAIAVFDFPSRLKFLSDQLPPAHPATGEGFLNGNTLLPLFLPFLPIERAERCREAALNDGGKKLPFLTGVMASRLTQPTHLRVCPKCIEENLATYGEAFWHRSHQIEGILTCHKHGTHLAESSIRRRGRQNRHEFHVPTTEWTKMEAADTGEDTQLAADTHWLLNQNTHRPGLVLLRESYIEALQERRLAHPSGRIYLSHLLEQFVEFHGRERLARLNCSLDADENWLAQLVRKGRVRCAHPIQHLLLIHFLGHTVQSFFEILMAPPTKPAVSAKALKPSRIKTVNTDMLKELWMDHTISLREISRRFDVDPMTIKRKAVQAGLKFPRNAVRPTRKKPARRTSQPKLRLQCHRRRWEKALRCGRQARQLLPSTYSYLYRFDREWLDAHRPPHSPAKVVRQRVNWPERDRLIAAKAEEIIRRGGNTPNPVAVYRELGITGLLRRNGHKLPLTMQVIRHSTLSDKAEGQRSFRTLLPNLKNRST